MSENLIASSASKARTLSDAEVQEIEHEMELYPDKQAVGLEALKIVQKHQGWVSDESMQAISKFLEIPISDLESVATFFNLVYRQPVGENVILFCNSVSCWVMGCESIRSHINERLGVDFGETSEDGKFTFLPVPCLGDCDKAPVMMVGDDLHRNLTDGKIDEIISNCRSKKESMD